MIIHQLIMQVPLPEAVRKALARTEIGRPDYEVTTTADGHVYGWHLKTATKLPDKASGILRHMQVAHIWETDLQIAANISQLECWDSITSKDGIVLIHSETNGIIVPVSQIAERATKPAIDDFLKQAEAWDHWVRDIVGDGAVVAPW